MISQLEWVYAQLQSLRTSTLVQIIDELGGEFPNNEFREMAIDIYQQAKRGQPLSDKQKRVLVNIIGQQPE